ncbi:hypothetical protein A3850_000660 [Lewinella sp. 4G2]|nr:hypothetical protein A3850_000660 [Lewinella sp. 4G2]
MRMQDMGLDERPRERMRRHGARSLSDAELLAVILGNGKRGVSALALSRQILRGANHNLHELARGDVATFCAYAGVGEVKALRLMASLELGRRREAALALVKPNFDNGADCARYLRTHLGDLDHEEFHILCLNRANRLLGHHRVSEGGVTGTVADAKRIFRLTLQHPSVTSLILAHNHPSGQAFPSQADRALTHKLAAAARHLDLVVLDHVIIAGRRHYSFAANKEINPEQAPATPAVK